MQTCKDWIFKEIYKNNKLTKSARILFVFLLAHCDEKGSIAIYHKDIENIVGIDTKTFYSALKLLEQAKATYKMPNGKKAHFSLIVRENKKRKDEIIVTIPNNSFVKPYRGEKKRYCNYVDLDFKCLKIKELKEMRHTELRVMLYLYFRASKHGNISDYTVFKSKLTAYTSIANQLGLKIQSVRKAISALVKKGIISFNHTNDINNDPCLTAKLQADSIAYDIHTDMNDEVISTSGGITIITHEKHFRADRHIVRNIIRRNKINKAISKQDINDISVLMHQYRQKAQVLGKDIETVFTNAINKCAIIKASVIHSCIRTILDL